MFPSSWYRNEASGIEWYRNESRWYKNEDSGYNTSEMRLIKTHTLWLRVEYLGGKGGAARIMEPTSAPPCSPRDNIDCLFVDS